MSTSQVRIPAEERRQQILELATELFAKQGYQGTTTRQIAQEVHVNEAIIFRHFPTKEELYWAVIENQIQARGGRARLEEKLSAGGSDRELLTAIAQELLGRDVTLSRLLLFTALENHELTHRFFRTHVTQYLDVLADYIRKGIAGGRFRDVDPALAARGFLGQLVYHFQIQELFGGNRVQTFEPHQVAEIMVDIWLRGMERK
jgi:AcrR family transcriptional regulator